MITFYKYHGTGNDFVLIDNRQLTFKKDQLIVEKLCDRRFGIGADGLILLENDESSDFRMVYYNSDGNESTMCGNGGRCIVAFAHFLGIFSEQCSFEAVDGRHEAIYDNGNVKLKMIDVNSVENQSGSFELNTGSPHFVQFVEGLDDYKVYENGNKIRNNATYKAEGINVNFVSELHPDEIFVRTYERGVEGETWSCGTGATAAALVQMEKTGVGEIKVKVLGGNLKVYAEKTEAGFKNVWLEGPAVQVFKGEITL